MHVTSFWMKGRILDSGSGKDHSLKHPDLFFSFKANEPCGQTQIWFFPILYDFWKIVTIFFKMANLGSNICLEVFGFTNFILVIILNKPNPSILCIKTQTLKSRAQKNPGIVYCRNFLLRGIETPCCKNIN